MNGSGEEGGGGGRGWWHFRLDGINIDHGLERWRWLVAQWVALLL